MSDDDLARLADAVLVGDGMRFTPGEVAARAGTDREFADRLWRSMGFPDLPDDDPVLTELDVDALARAVALAESGLADREIVLQAARTIGQAMARVADTLVGAAVEWAEANGLEGQPDALAGRLADLGPALLPSLDDTVRYLLHRHLLAAIERRLDSPTGASSAEAVVGFADLVGFTAMTRDLPQRRIAAAVNRFEAVAAESVVTHGGRVVKMIGDEAMFVVDDAGDAAAIAFDLIDRLERDELLPDVRVGLAGGPVVLRHGDVFGRTVNLASRVVAQARPGTVLADLDTAEAIAASNGFVARPLRRRSLQGLGRVPLAVVRRAQN